MKKLLFICFALVLLGPFSYAQQNSVLAVESYKLANGFTVFLNQDTTANRVFGAVMVNAGAKHEDPNATGMAHYLEHLLFKGTEHFGTADFAKEKPHLDSINVLYEKLALAQADEERASIQLLINEQAVAASAYGLPNEFDKMLKSIGGTGINAFTSMEMTFYHNSFPGHEINKWLDLYAARFQNPIFRSFQSELEVVYEEKNRAMDNFQRKIAEEMQQRIFANIPYGQWSVLGKVEHLKNPSLLRMYQFFEENYKAGNMALILSGNFDAELVKPVIEEKFNQLPAGTVEKLVLDQPTPFKGIEVVKKRMTPIKASFEGYHT
ncbi:MAG: insulinase family protein, partial [Bacteroidota bacterium]